MCLSGVWLQLCCCCWCLGPFVWKLLTPQLNCQQCPCHHHHPAPANCWVDNYTHQRGARSYLNNQKVLLSLGRNSALQCPRCIKWSHVHRSCWGSFKIAQIRMSVFPPPVPEHFCRWYHNSTIVGGHCVVSDVGDGRIMLCCVAECDDGEKCLIKSNIWLKSQINYNFQIGS